MPKAETYISIDIEASGPIPGPFYMMQLGAVAFSSKGTELGSFKRSLKPIEGSRMDPGTKKGFWDKYTDLLNTIEKEAMAPNIVMNDFLTWLSQFDKVVFMGYPVTYDFMWVHWYLMNFVGKNPSSFSAIDIKTMSYVGLGSLTYKDSTKGQMKKEWLEGLPPHTHDAEDDAREQGLLFFNIRKELRRTKAQSDKFSIDNSS